MSRTLTTVRVEGLRGTLANLNKLDESLRGNATKKAARAGGKVLAAGVAATIYTGLTEQTGLLRTGLGVTVGKARNGNRITAYVVERQIATLGKSAKAKVALKSAARHAHIGGRIAPKFGPFYWRFLELGTGQRSTKAGANRGASPKTGNVGKAFASASGAAIDTFHTVLDDEINKEAASLPSTKGVA